MGNSQDKEAKDKDKKSSTSSNGNGTTTSSVRKVTGSTISKGGGSVNWGNTVYKDRRVVKEILYI